ncbi:MAG TPA: hypothetical protein VN609_07940, partial [Propionibacteriaceae bacterium]|nr:hypothetical protein [Propionibacteriaceae bacterium]
MSSIIPGPAHQLQTLERLLRPGGVGALHGKAHMDQYPITWGEVVLLIKVEHPDVDLALRTRYVDQGELAAIALEPLDDLTGNAETHCLLHPLSDVVWIIDQLT